MILDSSVDRSILIDWNQVDTVLLDMDGTLLDLHFDNHFWLDFVPQQYAKKHQLTEDESRTFLMAEYQSIRGQLNWYCVDYWTHRLGLDIATLKHAIQHKIAIHPFVPEFLSGLKDCGKSAVLVTNAHRKSLDLKMKVTELEGHFDYVVSAHDLGLPKEEIKFWDVLKETVWFDPERTLFIDDNIAVLDSASHYGIRHCFAIRKPDSKLPVIESTKYPVVESFQDIIPCNQV